MLPDANTSYLWFIAVRSFEMEKHLYCEALLDSITLITPSRWQLLGWVELPNSQSFPN